MKGEGLNTSIGCCVILVPVCSIHLNDGQYRSAYLDEKGREVSANGKRGIGGPRRCHTLRLMQLEFYLVSLLDVQPR